MTDKIVKHPFVSDGEVATDLCRHCSRSREHQIHQKPHYNDDYSVEREFQSLKERNEQLVAEINSANEELRILGKKHWELANEKLALWRAGGGEKQSNVVQSSSIDVRYRSLINAVAKDDVDRLLKKDDEYGASWKRRGGVGAYMMMIRKIDRIMAIIPEPDGHPSHGFDVFAMLADESVGGSEQLLDTMRDLRGYLMLIEAEHRIRESDRVARLCLECGKSPCTCGTTVAVTGEKKPTGLMRGWCVETVPCKKCGGPLLNHEKAANWPDPGFCSGCRPLFTDQPENSEWHHKLVTRPADTRPRTDEELEEIDSPMTHHQTGALKKAVFVSPPSHPTTLGEIWTGVTKPEVATHGAEPESERRCTGNHDDGIADGNLTSCSKTSGCALPGCPYVVPATDDDIPF